MFLTNCIGCHSGMDPMAQAFAYYNFSYPASEVGATAWPIGQIVYTAGQTQPKYHINNTNFPQGFNTPDDSWTNRWRSGPNQNLGWSASLTGCRPGRSVLGNGAREQRCVRELPGHSSVQDGVLPRARGEQPRRARRGDAAQIQSMITSFQSNSYSLRQVFAEAAAYCKGN